MTRLDAPPIHTPPATYHAAPQAEVPGLLDRLRGQRALAPEPPSRAHPVDQLRRDIELLTAMVAEQHRLLARIADSLASRLDSVERVLDGIHARQPQPIEHFNGGRSREAVVRRPGLGRGLEALIPPRKDLEPARPFPGGSDLPGRPG